MENDLEKAIRVCAKLTTVLDDTMATKEDIDVAASLAATELKNLPAEVVIFAIRTQIQIDRLVKHNLDEHEQLGPIMSAINNASYLIGNQ